MKVVLVAGLLAAIALAGCVASAEETGQCDDRRGCDTDRAERDCDDRRDCAKDRHDCDRHAEACRAMHRCMQQENATRERCEARVREHMAPDRCPLDTREACQRFARCMQKDGATERECRIFATHEWVKHRTSGPALVVAGQQLEEPVAFEVVDNRGLQVHVETGAEGVMLYAPGCDDEACAEPLRIHQGKAAWKARDAAAGTWNVVVDGTLVDEAVAVHWAVFVPVEGDGRDAED